MSANPYRGEASLVVGGETLVLRPSFGALVAAEEELGSLFEGWIVGTIRAYGHYRDLYEDIAYWLPVESHTTEVDVLLRRGREHLAIEAKLGRATATTDLKGLRAIAELPGLVRRVLVCSTERARRTADGIDILPVSRFLAELAEDRLWP